MNQGTAVVISPVHWHFTWQASHFIARGFARAGYETIFVEPIPKRWPRIVEYRRVWGRLAGHSRLAGNTTQEVPPGVTVISPLALPDVGAIGRWLNRWLFMRRLASRITSGSLARPLLLIHHVPLPAALALHDWLAPDLAIYWCLSDWANEPHARRSFDETGLLQRVDEAWADCQYNLDRVSRINPQARIFGPAVDLDLFAPLATAQPPPRSRPLCAYFGTVGVAIDVDLLQRISHQYPLRIIGPLKVQLPAMGAETEVLGPVPHKSLPDLLADVDVLLLPYRDRPHVAGVIPAKLFECLITGKPVIATGLSTLDAYKDLIYEVDSADAFLEAIATCRGEDPGLRQRRIDVALENSTSARMAQMLAVVDQLLAEKAVPGKGAKEE